MTYWWDKSIRRQIQMIIMFVIVVALALSTLGLMAISREQIRNAMLNELTADADVVAFNVTAALAFDRPSAATEVIESLKYKQYILVAAIFDYENERFASYSSDRLQSNESKLVMGDDGQNREGDFLTVQTPIMRYNERLGTVVIQADIFLFHDAQQKIMKAWLLIMGGTLMLAMVMALRLQRRISGPIAHLAEVARTVSSESSYNVRAQLIRNDELGDLTRAFNEMLDEIQERQMELQSLSQVSRQIDFSKSLDQAFEGALDDIVTPLRPSAARLFVKRQGELRLVSKWSKEGSGLSGWLGSEVPFHGEFVGGQGKEPIFVNFGQKPESEQGEQLFENGIQALVCLPLSAGGEVFGLLEIATTTGQEFAKHRAFLETLASQVAIGLQNAMLYQKVVNHRKELEGRVAKRTLELETANDRLLELDRMKSIFLASMSHELRTPLNSIIGFTGIMIKGLSGDLNDEQQKQLGIVRRNAHLLLELICDVLDISKIESGRVDLSIELVTLNELVQEVVEAVSTKAITKNLEFFVDVPEHLSLNTDRRRLKQILLNLASNAVKFTDSGKISFIACQVDDDHLEVAVSDTGMGIKTDDLSKLFLPFQQLTNSLTKKAEGTGLGLYLSQTLAQLLGGGLRAVSEPDKGSTFTLRLPQKNQELIT